MFRFGASDMLFAYLLVPALVALSWWAAAQKRRDLARFGDRPLVDRLTATVSRRGQTAKTVLLVVTVALLVTALGSPQFGTRVETVRREGQDIVIALDLSASMVAEDMAPNRLQKAKFAIADLIDHLDGDRVGLVAFAGEAFVQSPLTLDYGAANLFLNAMDPNTMSVQGTNLGQAIEVALDALAETDRRHRVLVVITDGEDHEGAVDGAVERAREAGVQIYTVGDRVGRGGTDSGVRCRRPPTGVHAGRRRHRGDLAARRSDPAKDRDAHRRPLLPRLAGGHRDDAAGRGAQCR